MWIYYYNGSSNDDLSVLHYDCNVISTDGGGGSGGGGGGWCYNTRTPHYGQQTCQTTQYYFLYLLIISLYADSCFMYNTYLFSIST